MNPPPSSLYSHTTDLSSTEDADKENFAHQPIAAGEINCPLCPKRYEKRSVLTRHIRQVHQKKKRYICEGCGSSHTQYSNCVRHIRESCSEELRAVPCPNCPFRCDTDDQLPKHNCLKNWILVLSNGKVKHASEVSVEPPSRPSAIPSLAVNISAAAAAELHEPPAAPLVQGPYDAHLSGTQLVDDLVSSVDDSEAQSDESPCKKLKSTNASTQTCLAGSEWATNSSKPCEDCYVCLGESTCSPSNKRKRDSENEEPFLHSHTSEGDSVPLVKNADTRAASNVSENGNEIVVSASTIRLRPVPGKLDLALINQRDGRGSLDSGYSIGQANFPLPMPSPLPRMYYNPFTASPNPFCRNTSAHLLPPGLPSRAPTLILPNVSNISPLFAQHSYRSFNGRLPIVSENPTRIHSESSLPESQ